MSDFTPAKLTPVIRFCDEFWAWDVDDENGLPLLTSLADTEAQAVKRANYVIDTYNRATRRLQAGKPVKIGDMEFTMLDPDFHPDSLLVVNTQATGFYERVKVTSVFHDFDTEFFKAIARLV